jgi:hypothetical protein
MAVDPKHTLTRDQIAQMILDPGDAVRYIQKTWGKAVPDDMWDLLYHLQTVMALTRKELSDAFLRFRQKEGYIIDPDQLSAIENDLVTLENQMEEYFWPLNERAMEENPLVATPDWVRTVRDPVVFGVHPETGERSVPWSALPFRTLHMLVEHEADFAQIISDPAADLAPFAVFEAFARATKPLGTRLEEAAKEEAKSWLPWILLGIAGLYIVKGK